MRKWLFDHNFRCALGGGGGGGGDDGPVDVFVAQNVCDGGDSHVQKLIRQCSLFFGTNNSLFCKTIRNKQRGLPTPSPPPPSHIVTWHIAKR